MTNEEIKNMIDEQEAIENSMKEQRKIQIEALVGMRFINITSLENYMVHVLDLDVKHLIFSESERIKRCDFMIDGELADEEAFTLFYLFDNDKKIFITEV